MAFDNDYEIFTQKFAHKSGIDLHDYKPQQMQRRITNLMARHGATNYVDFFHKLERDATLYKEFVDYITINVTEFFRTPEKFTELQARVFHDLMAKSPKLNIWSAGCSTGAEPYTLAMILDQISPGQQHRIYATDIDSEMLAKAKAGSYGPAEIKNVSETILKKYFVQANGKYTVVPDIRSRVEFQRHNLLKDQFEEGFDLILCRNVVIYFTEEAKDQLYRRFYKALKPGGVLFVGGTECILNFREIGFNHYLPFFYRK